MLGAVGTLPGIFVVLEVSYYLLKRLLGVRTEGDKKAARVPKLARSEVSNFEIQQKCCTNVDLFLINKMSRYY